MKENVVDVLMYLFETYFDEDDDHSPDREDLQVKLFEAGFQPSVIEKAFDWLEGLATTQDTRVVNKGLAQQAMRIYHTYETERLDGECRGFILFLEQAGILTPNSRELVIDRVMDLDTKELDIDQLKWVILMVLYNLPGEEAPFGWVEDLVLEGSSNLLH